MSLLGVVEAAFNNNIQIFPLLQKFNSSTFITLCIFLQQLLRVILIPVTSILHSNQNEYQAII